jgi:hypothetical protein
MILAFAERATHFGKLHLAVYGQAEFSSLGIRLEGTDGHARVLLQPSELRDLSPYTVPFGDLDRRVVVVQHRGFTHGVKPDAPSLRVKRDGP